MNFFQFKNPLNKLSFKTRGYLTLASAFFQHLILGSYYVWGGILTYVTSYLRHDGQAYSKEDVAMLAPFVTLSLNVGTPFGPFLANKIGYKPLMFINSALFSISVIGSSYFVNNFPVFVILYGIIFGLISGTLYMVPFNTCYLYFPGRKGLVGGVITAGYALGSTALIWIMFAMINPHNEKPSVKIGDSLYFSYDVCKNLPYALRMLGVIQVICFYISTCFHIRPTKEEIENIMNDNKITPQIQSKESVCTENALEVITTQTALQKQDSEQVGLKQMNENLAINNKKNSSDQTNSQNNQEQQQQQQEQQQQQQQSADCVREQKLSEEDFQQMSLPESFYEYDTVKECLKTKFIYISIIIATMTTVYGSLVSSNYKILGEKSSYSDSFLNAAGTMGCVVNCFSRIFWGNLFEKYSLRRLATVNLLFQVLLSFTFYWCSKIDALFFLQILLTYFALGGWLSMMPAQIVRVYGRKIGTTIYSVTFVGFSISAFSAFFILKSASKSVGFTYMFWIFTGIQLVALLLVQVVDFTVKHRKAIVPKELIEQFRSKKMEEKL